MEENQEKKAQEEQVQDPELNVEEQENTDNLSEKEENTDKGKKNIFSRKRDKEKAKVQELEAELEKLKAEKAELNDRFLRLFSEFDNYKKRVSKEKLDLIATAENVGKMAEDVVEVHTGEVAGVTAQSVPSPPTRRPTI